MSTVRGVADYEGFLGALDSVTLEGDASGYSKEELTESRNKINATCKKELKKLRDELALTTLKRQITHYRNAIREHYRARKIALVIKSQFGRKQENPGHIALRYFSLARKERGEIAEREQVRKNAYLLGNAETIGDNDFTVIVNHTAYIETARRLALEGQSFYEIAAGLTALTGRRPFSEVIRAGFDMSKGFEKSGAGAVRFTGQAKANAARRVESFKVFVLDNADTVIRGLERLRAADKPEVVKRLQAGAVELAGLSGEMANIELNRILEASCSRPLGAVVKKHFTRYVQRCVKGDLSKLYPWSISPKNLRPIACQLTHILYAKNADLHAYARVFLGHEQANGRNNTDNYMEFRLHPKEARALASKI